MKCSKLEFFSPQDTYFSLKNIWKWTYCGMIKADALILSSDAL